MSEPDKNSSMSESISSSTDGFTSGGSNGVATLGDIDKFSFTAPNNSSDYGELTETKHSCSGADGS